MDPKYDYLLKRRQKGRMVFGVAVFIIGVLLLMQMFNLLPPVIYSMRIGWPLLLIGIGLAIGVKNNFRKNAWWILILIGMVHFIPPFYIGDVPLRRLLWPSLLIIAGLAIVLRKRDHHYHKWDNARTQIVTNDVDTLNIDVTFGGRKEIVTSRNFRGGIVRASFAGVEINMTSADSGIQPMMLEVHASFAGIELIVPSHWEI